MESRKKEIKKKINDDRKIKEFYCGIRKGEKRKEKKEESNKDENKKTMFFYGGVEIKKGKKEGRKEGKKLEKKERRKLKRKKERKKERREQNQNNIKIIKLNRKWMEINKLINKEKIPLDKTNHCNRNKLFLTSVLFFQDDIF